MVSQVDRNKNEIQFPFEMEPKLDGFPLTCHLELVHTIEKASLKAQKLVDIAKKYI